MSIKRYTFDPDTYSGSGCECSIEECKQGEYVCSEDYDRLEAQLEAVRLLVDEADAFGFISANKVWKAIGEDE